MVVDGSGSAAEGVAVPSQRLAGAQHASGEGGDAKHLVVREQRVDDLHHARGFTLRDREATLERQLEQVGGIVGG